MGFNPDKSRKDPEVIRFIDSGNICFSISFLRGELQAVRAREMINSEHD
jgi:hypothetical protein